MKTIKRDFNNTNVCIYSFDGEFLIGSFFKEKPKIGDILDCTPNIPLLEITEILENRDAIIQKNCKKMPEKAWFKLKCKSIEI